MEWQKMILDIENEKNNDFSVYVKNRLDKSFEVYQDALEHIKESLSNKNSINVIKNL